MLSKDKLQERIKAAISENRKLVLRLYDLPSKTVNPNSCKLSDSALIVSDPKHTAYFPLSIIREVEFDGEMGTAQVLEKV